MITALRVPVEGAVVEVELPGDRALHGALRNHVGAQRVKDVALTLGPTMSDGEDKVLLELWHSCLAGPANPRIAELIGPVFTAVTGEIRGPVLLTGMAADRTCSLPADVLDELTARWS